MTSNCQCWVCVLREANLSEKIGVGRGAQRCEWQGSTLGSGFRQTSQSRAQGSGKPQDWSLLLEYCGGQTSPRRWVLVEEHSTGGTISPVWTRRKESQRRFGSPRTVAWEVALWVAGVNPRRRVQVNLAEQMDVGRKAQHRRDHRRHLPLLPTPAVQRQPLK